MNSSNNENLDENQKKIEEEKEKEKKLIQLSIENAKKFYTIYNTNPNSLFISQIKTKSLNIILANYNFNDISVMNKILKKYFFFTNITLTSSYEHPKENNEIKNKVSIQIKKKREPISEGEKNKMDKEKREKEIEKINMINKIIIAIGSHLSLSQKLNDLTIDHFNFSRKSAERISKGIIENNSIKKLNINNCHILSEDFEILFKGLLNHPKIEYLILHNNNIEDKCGNMIGRIITRQTFRRDQDIWLCGIRNEKPNKNKGLGLVSINLNGNKLSNYSAECITKALASDQYIRSITLANNSFDENSCKKFIYMLRKNVTLLNIDLRENPGYVENIKYRLVLKMSKNINHLYNQYKNNIYTEEEFQYFKSFIDTSFFSLDIPKDIIKQFNENNKDEIININNKNVEDALLINEKKYNKKPSTSIDNKTKINLKTYKNSRPISVSNININKYENNSRYINSSENKNYNKKIIYDNKTLLKSNKKENYNNNKNSGNNNNNNMKYNCLSLDKKNISAKNPKIKNKKLDNLDNIKTFSLDKNNNKLLKENLFLKRKIIEFKAKDIQNKLGKNIIIPTQYDNNNLNNNFNIVNELLDILNKLMYSMEKGNKYEINLQNNNIKSIQNYIEINNNKNNNNNNNYKDNIKEIIKKYINNSDNNKSDDSKENKDKFNNIDYSDII